MMPSPLFSRDTDLETIRQLDRVGLVLLSAMALLTAIFSGVGFLNQFPDAGLFEFSMALLFGFSVWLIAKMFWLGAWILPQFMLSGSLLAAYIVVAVFGFSAFGTISYFGNQRAIAGEVSQSLSDETRADALENNGGEATAYLALLQPVAAELAARTSQANASASAEVAGNGPTGVGGAGPVYRSFLNSSRRYAEAQSLVENTLRAGERLSQQLSGQLENLRSISQDGELTAGQKRTQIKIAAGQVIDTINQIRSLNPAGTVRAAAQTVAQGVPNQSGASSSSQARISEIRSSMVSYARTLDARANEIAERLPSAPQAFSLSQEEGLIDNIFRIPGLSMAALFFDFCGWIVIGFRYVAYHALRRRDQAEHSQKYNAYLTLDDLKRIEAMAQHVTETRRSLQEMRDVTPDFPQIENTKREGH